MRQREVAVVVMDDERLDVRGIIGLARGWVPVVADAGRSQERRIKNGRIAEDIEHEPGPAVHRHYRALPRLVVGLRNDPRRLLPPVLERVEAVIDTPRGVFRVEDAENAAVVLDVTHTRYSRMKPPASSTPAIFATMSRPLK